MLSFLQRKKSNDNVDFEMTFTITTEDGTVIDASQKPLAIQSKDHFHYAYDLVAKRIKYCEEKGHKVNLEVKMEGNYCDAHHAVVAHDLKTLSDYLRDDLKITKQGHGFSKK